MTTSGPSGPADRPVRVLAAGVFDILHPGHLHYLAQAAALGHHLVVVVATDASVTRRKRAPVVPQDARRTMVAALAVVDEAVIGHPDDHYKTVETVRPDIIAIGHDDGHDEAEVVAECKRRGLDVRVVRCAPLDQALAGTSRILDRIRAMDRDGVFDGPGGTRR